MTSFTSIDGTADYGYDPTNQLASATHTTASGGHQPANESFSFDANGNRNMSGYTTGGDNLMSIDGRYNYKYDADGNTISRTQIASTYSTQYLTTYTLGLRRKAPMLFVAAAVRRSAWFGVRKTIVFYTGNHQRFDVRFVPLRHHRLHAGGALIDR